MRLADGQRWRITAAEEVQDIAGLLCRVAGLKPDGPDGDNLMLVKRGTLLDGSIVPGNVPDLLSSYPVHGWSIERSGPVNIWRHESTPDVVCEVLGNNGDEYLDLLFVMHSLYPVYMHALDHGGLTLHCATVALDGKGVAIAANSGTGKSTCYKRIDKPWERISDEEALVLMAGGSYRFHPMPTWSNFVDEGSRKPADIRQHFPLSALFFLEQSSKDEVVPLGKGKAAVCLYQSCVQLFRRYWASSEPSRIAALNQVLFDNACRISSQVPAYTLRATLDGRFWDEMEKVLPD